MKNVNESISVEQDLLNKLVPLPEQEIFEFMKNLRSGTYFNMGMFSYIPVSRAYKKTFRLYKVMNMTAIVSGVSYENIGTTKEFRDRTEKAAGKAWYDHMQGYENKVGVKKSDVTSKYVLWDVKASTDTWVRFYLVDTSTGTVKPLSKEEVLASDYLTATEKAKMQPKPVEGFDKNTGELVENKTTWRTAKFENIFWLSQAGKNTKEYGVKFMESTKIRETRNLKENVEIFPETAYVIKTDDGQAYKDVYLAWSNDFDGYTTVDYIDEIGEGDYKTSIDEIIHNAEDANSMTFGGWEAPMNIVKITNFRNAYANGEDPEETVVKTISFNESMVEVLEEATDIDLFIDAHANVKTDLDAILSGSMDESCDKTLEKPSDLKESYRRIVARGNTLVNNELFVNFE